MGGDLQRVMVEFHPSGSLATTHESQGSDMGLFGGLLGWEAADPRLVDSKAGLAREGLEVELSISDYDAPHPNTYRMTLEGSSARHTMTAISIGGGMVKVLDVDGQSLSMAGDCFETLVFVDDTLALPALQERLEKLGTVVHGTPLEGDGRRLVRASGEAALSDETVKGLAQLPGVQEVRVLKPVLPVLTKRDASAPFLTAQEMVGTDPDGTLDLWELASRYESARGGISEDEVFEKMSSLVEILETSVEEGLKGTEYSDRILGPQAGAFQELMETGDLLDGGLLNTIILYVTAFMEVKSSMGVIVAAPTAGACGALPGACLGAGSAMGLDRDQVTRGMLAAGMVGVFIAAHSTFAAEVCGCQAECGAGSGMAAAALVTLAGGTTRQALSASSMAIQNTLGMICDPVANRVEVPCLGRNVLAASNALACANMALAGFDAVIPLDEVIETMDRVGKSLPHELRCTALGGLSITPTSKRIEDELKERR
jgi:L-serine dehydratase